MGAAIESRGPKAALVPHPVTVVGHGRRRPSVLGQSRKEAGATRWPVGWSGNSLSRGEGRGEGGVPPLGRRAYRKMGLARTDTLPREINPCLVRVPSVAPYSASVSAP